MFYSFYCLAFDIVQIIKQVEKIKIENNIEDLSYRDLENLTLICSQLMGDIEEDFFCDSTFNK